MVENEPQLDAGQSRRRALLLAPVEPLAVDAKQAADLLGLARSTFYKMQEAGRIGPQGIHFSRCVRFSLAELRAWAAAGMPPRHEWERLKSNSAR